ncbi:hypothetical protein TNCV_3887351 [Trichonephila clavipes]|nr:hypothetical protein TNCV_3887351 [Trichonephila clavipes]
MFDSSSFVNPTPLAHSDTSRDVLPKGGKSQNVSLLPVSCLNYGGGDIGGIIYSTEVELLLGYDYFLSYPLGSTRLQQDKGTWLYYDLHELGFLAVHNRLVLNTTWQYHLTLRRTMEFRKVYGSPKREVMLQTSVFTH